MTTGGGDDDDRLSALSDDLLRRILYFVDSKEAASTSVLSRRWGSLWRSSGAVNLAVQVQDYKKNRCDRSYSYDQARDALFSCQEAFVHAAKAALDAAEAPITRLTLLVESSDGDDDSSINQFLCRSRDWPRTAAADVVGALVSHQAARRVEELRVAVDSSCGFLYSPEKENHKPTGIYGLASLPSSDTLRVLDLARCSLKTAFPLPRLGTLRLTFCSVEPKVLKDLLDAATVLTTVQLESLFFPAPRRKQTTRFHGHHPGELDREEEEEPEPGPPVLRLSFQAVTTLVLSLCGMEVQGGSPSWAIEVDAPRLQSFKYKGLMRRFVLGPAAAPGVARVDLHFLQFYEKDGEKETSRSTLFWQFVHNFANARTLKLKVDNELKDIAAIGEARRAMLLRALPNVERLDLEGVHHPKSKTAAVAIANLLHCCPALGETTLKLSTATDRLGKDSRYGHEFLKRKDRSDYNKSMDRFVRRRRKANRAISMEDGVFGDKYSYDDVPRIPGLSGRSFACLQRTLTSVGLQFQLDNNSISSCLGLRLIKFFAEHAKVLEEMCVDTGNRRLDEHLNFNVQTQIALAHIPISATSSSIQHKNLAQSSSKFSGIPSASLDSATDHARSTVGFMVLPLKRQKRMDWEP